MVSLHVSSELNHPILLLDSELEKVAADDSRGPLTAPQKMLQLASGGVMNLNLAFEFVAGNNAKAFFVVSLSRAAEI